MTAPAANAPEYVAETTDPRPVPRIVDAPAKYYTAFDFLRISLAMGVFAFHGNLLGLEDRWPHSGNFCVQVFFALSGYLIGGLLAGSSKSSLPRFYFNRTVRIWIPYSIAIGILATASALKHQPLTYKLAEFFTYKLTFTYDLFAITQTSLSAQMPLSGSGHHFWSICAEEQFYLVAPILITILRRRAVWGILAFGSAATAYNPGLFGSITLGVLLALSDRERPRWFYRRRFLLPAIGLVGLLVWAYFSGFVAYDFAAPIASVVLVALLSYQGKPSAVGQFVGGVSYPFYLNHWIGLVFIKPIAAKTGLPRDAALAVALVIALALSSAHYLFIDRTIHKKRGGWFTGRRGLVCAGVGFTLVCAGIAAHFILWPSPS